MSKSAASFIDQIKASYQEVVKAESGALPHAIRCGEFLTLAKENLKAEKGGKWLDWLDTNCKEIARETASLYMRLAEHKAKLGKARSIAEARKLFCPRQSLVGGRKHHRHNRTRHPTTSPRSRTKLRFVRPMSCSRCLWSTGKTKSLSNWSS